MRRYVPASLRCSFSPPATQSTGAASASLAALPGPSVVSTGCRRRGGRHDRLPISTIWPVRSFDPQANFFPLVNRTCLTLGPNGAVLFAAHDSDALFLAQTLPELVQRFRWPPDQSQPGDSAGRVERILCDRGQDSVDAGCLARQHFADLLEAEAITDRHRGGSPGDRSNRGSGTGGLRDPYPVGLRREGPVRPMGLRPRRRQNRPVSRWRTRRSLSPAPSPTSSYTMLNRSAALVRRITTLLSALRSPPANSTADGLLAELDSALHDPQPEESWLALSVLTGQLPDVAEVQRTITRHTSRRTARSASLPALDQNRQSRWSRPGRRSKSSTAG